MPRRPLLAIVVALAGCQTVIGADFDEALPRGETTTCRPVQPPSEQSLPPTGGELEIVTVIHSVDYGDRVDADGRGSYLDVGYDIDGTCTTSRATASCAAPEWTGAEPEDGPGGRDNGVGRILVVQTEITGVQVIGSASLNEAVHAGTHAPLGVLRVRGFGGFSDDDRVSVEWFVPAHPQAWPGGPRPLKLDGTDAIPPDASHLTQNGSDVIATARDEAAFVTKRTLVARFDELALPMANVRFAAHDVVLTATVIRDTVTNRWELTDGLLAAHAPEEVVLRVVPEIGYAVAGVALCPDDPNFAGVKRMICSGVDVRHDGKVDSTARCDAASVGIGFQAIAATLDQPVVGSPPPDFCGAKFTDADRRCEGP